MFYEVMTKIVASFLAIWSLYILLLQCTFTLICFRKDWTRWEEYKNTHIKHVNLTENVVFQLLSWIIC